MNSRSVTNSSMAAATNGADFSQTIVRDLWALRLQTCARTAAQASGSDTEGPSSSSQVFSSQSESESASASRSSRRGKKASIRNVESASSLVDTLVCCYIGMLLLRLPVTVADIHRWTNEGDLLYYRASREIALNVRERLPGRYQRMLEPEHLLKPQDLHGHVLETLKAMHKRYGMAMPVINTSLVLFRWVKMLALPLETFAAAQRLARMLDIEIAFQLEVKAVALRHPEAQLMALLVVATKLLFPPDDIERCAATSTDLCALVFDWQAWVAIQEKQLQRGIEPCSLSFEQAFNFEESDCVEAADDRLDAYLDWYQDNIATEKIREHGQAGNDAELRRTMFRLFPTAHQKTTATQSTNITARDEMDGSTRLTQTMLTPRNLRGTDTANAHAVGTFYSRFRNAEELSGPVKVLYERAAVLASLSLDGMVQAVFLTERRVQKYEDGLRKSTKQGRASRDID